MECRDQSCTKRNSKFHRWEIHFGRFRRNTIESSWHSALIKGECVRQDKTVRETKTKQPIRFCDLTRSWDTNRNWFSSRNVREISSSKNRTTRLGQLYINISLSGSILFVILTNLRDLSVVWVRVLSDDPTPADCLPNHERVHRPLHVVWWVLLRLQYSYCCHTEQIIQIFWKAISRPI